MSGAVICRGHLVQTWGLGWRAEAIEPVRRKWRPRGHTWEAALSIAGGRVPTSPFCDPLRS